MFRFTIAVKFIILLTGFFCLYKLLSFGLPAEAARIGLGIAAAGCFIAYALIENNDVREANKD